MALEAGTHIDDLVVTNPASTDGLAQADDHIRLIKTTLKNTFPNVTGAVTATHGALNALSGFSGTVDDLTYSKDLRATGVTATEFDYLDGVSSNIQTQLDTIQVIPTGLISLWSGAANAIPTGYVICDGTNSTPDLRNRFLIGAGSTYAVGATGGSADAIIPAHTHALTGASTDTHNLSGSLVASKPQAATGAFSVVGGQGGGADGGQSTAGLYTLADSHNHALSGSTDSTGVSATDANLPPYFALCYIMKT